MSPRPALLLSLLLLLLLPGVSRADRIHVERLDDGGVVIEAWVSASPQSVRAVLAGPFERGELTSEVRAVRTLSVQGACRRILIDATMGPAEFNYTVRRCDTAAGLVETLLSSEVMESMDAEWTVDSMGEGARIRLFIRSSLDIPVPSAVQQRYVSASAQSTVERLMAAAHDLEAL